MGYVREREMKAARERQIERERERERECAAHALDYFAYFHYFS